MTGAAGGRGHAVEGRRDVGAHSLAVAVDERARVAAPARHRGQAGPAARRWGRLGDSPGDDRGADWLQLGADRDLGPQGRKRVGVGKSDVEPPRVGAVGAGGADRRLARPGEIRRAAEVGRIRGPVRKPRRRRQARHVVAHRARRRERREVGCALQASLPGQRPGDRDDRQGGDQQDRHAADHRRQRLPAGAGQRPQRPRPASQPSFVGPANTDSGQRPATGGPAERMGRDPNRDSTRSKAAHGKRREGPVARQLGPDHRRTGGEGGILDRLPPERSLHMDDAGGELTRRGSLRRSGQPLGPVSGRQMAEQAPCRGAGGGSAEPLLAAARRGRGEQGRPARTRPIPHLDQ